jgi:hypothetical protein
MECAHDLGEEKASHPQLTVRTSRDRSPPASMTGKRELLDEHEPRIPEVIEVSPQYDETYLRDRSVGEHVPVTPELLGMSAGLRRHFVDWNHRSQVFSRAYIKAFLPDSAVE